MLKALSLIALGAIYRLVPHPWNAVPMGGLSLYAGASLPRRWAWTVPLAAMGLSDLVLDYATGRSVFDFSRCLIYATFAAITLLGPLAQKAKFGPLRLAGLSFGASALFFMTSNFGAWLVLEADYPRTLPGLLACYAAGIPFFHQTVLADLAGTAALFGLGALLERAKHLVLPAKPAPALEAVESTLSD